MSDVRLSQSLAGALVCRYDQRHVLSGHGWHAEHTLRQHEQRCARATERERDRWARRRSWTG